MNFSKEMAKLKTNKIAPIYLILGTESYLNRIARETFIHSILKKDEIDLNLGIYDMEEVPLGVALEDAESVPFFGDRRLVIVDRPIFLTGDKGKPKFEHDIKWFENYLIKPSATTIFVIFAPYEKLDDRKKISKLLKKNAVIIETPILSEKEMRSYLKTTIENEEFKISPEAFELFIQLTDAKLSVAMSELPKLLLYGQENKYITKDAVSELITKSLEQNIFSLNDYVLKKKVGLALELYHDLLLQKEDPIKINAIMTSQFRLLLQVKILEKRGYQQGDIAKILKVHPYRIKLSIQHMKPFSKKVLADAYNGLIETEYRLKTGQGEKNMQFELFVLQFARNYSIG
ncbi:MAG: DNA polymerase III subunit delta [Carnobacterium sp.]|uniref:DNA polymerase III subunit delta n=1 Tax=Carnobacterium sp. TaxID=48221 RepID=UPI003C74D8B8